MEKQTPVSVKRQKSSYLLYWHQDIFIWIISYYTLWIYSKAGEVTNFLNDNPESGNYKLFGIQEFFILQVSCVIFL